ncbi:hypothetical protein PR048_001653 [Dryococelus australis]|uniref:Uncharacterized protein n=1 Tax=Dryococelus australis TaxID=614101 RepID=A0ABQ9II46_9NEOP|nr:hypothetical protein PR048_001653 [Dryococelus australis]
MMRVQWWVTSTTDWRSSLMQFQKVVAVQWSHNLPLPENWLPFPERSPRFSHVGNVRDVVACQWVFSGLFLFAALAPRCCSACTSSQHLRTGYNLLEVGCLFLSQTLYIRLYIVSATKNDVNFIVATALSIEKWREKTRLPAATCTTSRDPALVAVRHSGPATISPQVAPPTMCIKSQRGGGQSSGFLMDVAWAWSHGVRFSQYCNAGEPTRPCRTSVCWFSGVDTEQRVLGKAGGRAGAFRNTWPQQYRGDRVKTKTTHLFFSRLPRKASTTDIPPRRAGRKEQFLFLKFHLLHRFLPSFLSRARGHFNLRMPSGVLSSCNFVHLLCAARWDHVRVASFPPLILPHPDNPVTPCFGRLGRGPILIGGGGVDEEERLDGKALLSERFTNNYKSPQTTEEKEVEALRSPLLKKESNSKLIQERRIVDIPYFCQQIVDIDNHPGFHCTFKAMKFLSGT